MSGKGNKRKPQPQQQRSRSRSVRKSQKKEKTPYTELDERKRKFEDLSNADEKWKDEMLDKLLVYLQTKASLGYCEARCNSNTTKSNHDCLGPILNKNKDKLCRAVAKWCFEFGCKPEMEQRRLVADWTATATTTAGGNAQNNASGSRSKRPTYYYHLPSLLSCLSSSDLNDDTSTTICQNALLTMLGKSRTFWGNVLDQVEKMMESTPPPPPPAAAAAAAVKVVAEGKGNDTSSAGGSSSPVVALVHPFRPYSNTTTTAITGEELDVIPPATYPSNHPLLQTKTGGGEEEVEQTTTLGRGPPTSSSSSSDPSSLLSPYSAALLGLTPSSQTDYSYSGSGRPSHNIFAITSPSPATKIPPVAAAVKVENQIEGGDDGTTTPSGNTTKRQRTRTNHRPLLYFPTPPALQSSFPTGMYIDEWNPIFRAFETSSGYAKQDIKMILYYLVHYHLVKYSESTGEITRMPEPKLSSPPTIQIPYLSSSTSQFNVMELYRQTQGKIAEATELVKRKLEDRLKKRKQKSAEDKSKTKEDPYIYV